MRPPDDYSNIDRRLALAYGGLILSLMLAVLLATCWFFFNTMQREQDRLASLTTQVLADSLARVSFSGKYQARLLLEDLTTKNPRVAYIRLAAPDGTLTAHSESNQNDSQLDASETAFLQQVLQTPGRMHTRYLSRGGESIREVSLAYYGGFDNRLQSVLQLGISEAGMREALLSNMAYILMLLVFLLMIGMLATHFISRHFAMPVRRLAQERETEKQRLACILDAINCATWEWNIETDEVILDTQWADIIGYSLAELQPVTSRTALLLTHPDDIELNAAMVRAHLRGESERYISETRVQHKNGHWVWVRDNGMVTERKPDGTPLKMLGARQDITLRKLAEETALQESERFLALIKASNTGVWEWDSNKQTLWCGAEYFSMLGYSKDDFYSSTDLQHVWTNLLHPDDKQRATDCFAAYLAGDTEQLYENVFRMRHANGSWVWISSRGRTLRDAGNTPSKLTVGAHINISSLKEAQTSLQESQQLMQAISDSIPDSMVYRIDLGTHGEQRVFTYISRGVEQLHGLTVEQAMANSQLIYDQFIVDRQQMQAYENECRAELKDFHQELEIIRPDGERRWMLLVSSPRRLANGHLVLDGIELDITARRQQEQQILELNSSLEQRVAERTAELWDTLNNLQRAQNELLQSEKLASLGALVAGIAHELNTPIGNALMVATSFEATRKAFEQSMQTGLTRSALTGLLDEVREGNLIIERNLERAAELIGSFKQLAVDQTSYQRRRFELKVLCHEILLTLQPTLRKKPYQLHSELNDACQMDSYPGPLGQVLINLINNAIVHAFVGREQGNITLDSRLDGDTVVIRVSDDGLGMEAESLKKIFDPFYTTRLGQGGSGLGLHIVYTLVTGLLGGRIVVNSEPGNGCCFTLYLPQVAPLPS